MQCRSGHGFIGEYYSKFVPSKNVDCPCGAELQTREHILRECPRYEDFRYVLQKVSQDICLADILGKEEGIEALIEFLDLSGAFTVTGRPRNQPEPPMYRPRGIQEELDEWFNNNDEDETDDNREADWRDEVVDEDDHDTVNDD
ncbi:hypothetical protein F5878DRAFT_549730 [Lentinula raphanica]|uniref:Uncharacterized protein n=1 Tax=Lentinula raphanica TaxID=153919 RepID=A0AA38NVC8_9AGAR|nr:hypothetical protein F5878DRAFT_549730 [Lentinula raphanica]